MTGKRPNFFILGAPKCGTTALASWLGEHPNVFMSPVKEPHFYSTDLKNRQARTRKEYERLFRGVSASHTAVGEASVWYLYSELAVPNILAEIPDAKFIVCLRNPVEMAYSLHGQQILANNEQIKDFVEAWNAQDQRSRSENVTRLCVDPKLLLYGPACKLGAQLQRLLALCGPEQVKVVFLEDMKKDAASVYQDVLKFLDVVGDTRTTFPVVNAASERRSQALSRAVKATSLMRRRLGVPRLGTGLMSFIDRINRQKSTRESMKPKARCMLIDYFQQDMVLIEKLTGRTLDHWKSDR